MAIERVVDPKVNEEFLKSLSHSELIYFVVNLRAIVALLEAEKQTAETALLASERLRANLYKEWGYAGGPNECEHGYAKGIDCPRCDEQAVNAYLARPTAAKQGE